MKKMTTVKFTCPECHASFEFDSVGEYEFVPCPVCGTDCFTIKKGNKLLLQIFDPDQMSEAPAILA
ncbi:MAG: hypothetical protein M1167_01205 [Chloroflexi bacterium]|nr:hypothetical protein [Chloroflexota bacterium]MCL5949066.1 hypothetical protein [Candidatus Bathyarchaeota archaeon]